MLGKTYRDRLLGVLYRDRESLVMTGMALGVATQSWCCDRWNCVVRRPCVATQLLCCDGVGFLEGVALGRNIKRMSGQWEISTSDLRTRQRSPVTIENSLSR